MSRAFVIIDMQKDVLERLVKAGNQIIRPLKTALEKARQDRIPVIYLLREHRANGMDVDFFRLQMFKDSPFLTESSTGAEIVEELKPLPDEFKVIKRRFSGFFQTELLLLLLRMGIKELILTGVQTPNSIRTTATDAISYDFSVSVIEDASTAQTQEIHQANLLDLKSMGVKILSTADFVKE